MRQDKLILVILQLMVYQVVRAPDSVNFTWFRYNGNDNLFRNLIISGYIKIAWKDYNLSIISKKILYGNKDIKQITFAFKRSFPSHFYFSSEILRSNSVNVIMKIKLYLMQYKLIDLMEIIEKIYI